MGIRSVFLASQILALACSTPEGTTIDGASPAVDAAVVDTGASDLPRTPDAAAACHGLVLDAPAVGLSYDPGAPPMPRGGTIAGGTYFLTAQVVYATMSGSTIPLGRTKVVVDGTTWQ